MNVASVAVPTVSHAPISTSGLAEKVSIRNLDFYYGTSKALKAISLPLYENKVTAFIGPSGCGKSTLLRILKRMYDLYPNQRAEGDVLEPHGLRERPEVLRGRDALGCRRRDRLAHAYRLSRWMNAARSRHPRLRNRTTTTRNSAIPQAESWNPGYGEL